MMNMNKNIKNISIVTVSPSFMGIMMSMMMCILECGGDI